MGKSNYFKRCRHHLLNDSNFFCLWKHTFVVVHRNCTFDAISFTDSKRFGFPVSGFKVQTSKDIGIRSISAIFNILMLNDLLFFN